MRSRPDGHIACDLPENILCGCTTDQLDIRGIAHREILSNLKDPHVGRATREGDVRRDQKSGAPFVNTTSERHPTNISGAELGDVGCAARGIGICKLHVADGCGQVGRCGRRVVGCVNISGHLRRGCEHIGRIQSQREPRDEGCGGGADPNISDDVRCRNCGDPRFRQDREVAGHTKIHGRRRRS